MRLPFKSSIAAILLPLSVLLAGCGASFAPSSSPIPGTASLSGISGRVHGGPTPISGAAVYVYAAGTGGYGGPSMSLLNVYSTGAFPTAKDGGGNYYVTTDSTGAFALTGEYVCTSGQQVYLYVKGGNSGGGTNSAIGLLAILGQCPASGTMAALVPMVFVNEVSTVAAAYAFAGFATDATDVSDDEAVGANTTASLAQTGMANAFGNAANLAGIATGAALTTTPAGNGTVPQTEIDTIANILASCVNASGPGSGGCPTLFADAKHGTTAPTDTATAAINIAQSPGANVTALYYLQPSSPPFQPALASTPNDFTLAISYTGGGLSQPAGVAIDGSGDAWFSNYRSTSEFSPLGAAISPAGGFTGGNQADGGGAIAIDTGGNVWLAGYEAVTELSSAGAVESGASGYATSYVNYPTAIAIDGSNNSWIVNNGNSSVFEINSAGTEGYYTGMEGGGVLAPASVAIDSSNHAWITNYNNLLKFSSSGLLGTYTGGGVSGDTGYDAIDASGNIWFPNPNLATVSEFSNTGTALSGSGYAASTLSNQGSSNTTAIDGVGNVWVSTQGSVFTVFSNSGTVLSGVNGYSGGNTVGFGVAVDGSGNVWTPSRYYNVATGYTYIVLEYIGAASPVVTPLATGVLYNKLGTRP